MALKDRFQTQKECVDEGVWFPFAHEPNPDGSIPAFKLSFTGKQNVKYTAALRKRLAGADLEAIPEDEAAQLLLTIFVDTILLDWENFQPEEDGFSLPFTRENAIKILGDDSWTALYQELQEKARKVANFRKKTMETQAKN